MVTRNKKDEPIVATTPMLNAELLSRYEAMAKGNDP